MNSTIIALQETYEESAARESSKIVQQKVVEHQKVLVQTIVDMNIDIIIMLASSRWLPEISHPILVG